MIAGFIDFVLPTELGVGYTFFIRQQSCPHESAGLSSVFAFYEYFFRKSVRKRKKGIPVALYYWGFRDSEQTFFNQRGGRQFLTAQCFASGRGTLADIMEDNQGEIIIYQSEDGLTHIDVKIENETVWLTLDQMADLFDRDKSTISRHIKNIFKEGELRRESVVANFATTAADGKTYQMDYYNLDVIISVGYRVKSIRGTQFRRWATERLKEYMIKGFTMDDDRLKQLGGGNYWKELLDRIRDIRSSEKVLYRQVLDLYATSVDYDPKSPDSVMFFKIVQNKLHYAAHGHTAAEVVYDRADATKPFMGMQAFTGDFPTAKDIGIAKNYLTEDELKILNNLVSGYFDFA